MTSTAYPSPTGIAYDGSPLHQNEEVKSPSSSNNGKAPKQQHQKLLGIGSQYFSAGKEPQRPRDVRMEEALKCPYHGPILQERLKHPQSGKGLSPMDRFLAESPAEQSAMFRRPDTGHMSTYRACRCAEIMPSIVEAIDDGQAPK